MARQPEQRVTVDRRDLVVLWDLAQLTEDVSRNEQNVKNRLYVALELAGVWMDRKAAVRLASRERCSVCALSLADDWVLGLAHTFNDEDGVTAWAHAYCCPGCERCDQDG